MLHNPTTAEDKLYAESLSTEELRVMVFDGEVVTADGCSVEPDGQCCHGHLSPLRVLGII
jgi:hypothetical protein